MNRITRRSALRAIGLSAPAANMIAGKMTRDMMSNPGIANIGSPNPEPAAQESAPMTFTSFSDWFREVGEGAIKEEAQHISGFDADICEMYLPLATKVRMQRARNVKRILAKRQNWFARALQSRKVVTWWR